MLRMTWWQEIAHSISYGRHGLEVSASMPITTLPPARGCKAASVVGTAASVPVGAAVVWDVAAAVVPGAAAVVPAVVAAVPLEFLLSLPPQATATRPRLTNAAAISRVPDRCLFRTISPSVLVMFSRRRRDRPAVTCITRRVLGTLVLPRRLSTNQADTVAHRGEVSRSPSRSALHATAVAGAPTLGRDHRAAFAGRRRRPAVLQRSHHRPFRLHRGLPC